MILSDNQNELLSTILPIAELALNNPECDSPLKARTHTLLCAPSGTGKSHLMKKLGEITKAPVLFLNVSSWMPQGSNKGNSHTFDSIVKFIEDNPRGIIILDELDKINNGGDWAGYVRLEIHDLLDGVIPECIDFKEEDDDDLLW